MTFLCSMHNSVGEVFGTEFQQVLEANNKTEKSFRQKEIFSVSKKHRRKIK